MNKFETNIGKNIKEVRNERKLTQETLSNMCGFSNTTLSSYENGRKIPSLSTIAKIAKSLQVSIERLYYGDENKSFIISEPNEGKKIVNSVYYLWKCGVIHHCENVMGGTIYVNNVELAYANGIYVRLDKFIEPIVRLVNMLNDYENRKNTYPDSNKYLDMVLDSTAIEINEIIKKENECKK